MQINFLPMDFDDIRSYTDSEVNEAMQLIVRAGKAEKFLASMVTSDQLSYFMNLLPEIHTIYDFQGKIISRILSVLLEKSGTSLLCNHLDQLDKSKSYLFISNHRDIILDPSFLNYILFNNNYNTSEVAIGNNLLIEPWIEAIVRLNKSFIVKRDLAGRELFFASLKLSKYIRQKLISDNSCVWIAQREGRAKDGNDTTQTSLLKMLQMSADAIAPSEAFGELNIVPVAITYEFDPCDVLKAKELYLNSIGIEYVKTPEDDLLSMLLGLLKLKGNISYSFSGEIKKSVLAGVNDVNKAFELLANEIDNRIYSGYTIFPSHFYSFDRYHGISRFRDKYSTEYAEYFDSLIQSKIDEYLPEFKGNTDFMMHVYRQYSNILKNAFTVNPKIIK